MDEKESRGENEVGALEVRPYKAIIGNRKATRGGEVNVGQLQYVAAPAKLDIVQ